MAQCSCVASMRPTVYRPSCRIRRARGSRDVVGVGVSNRSCPRGAARVADRPPLASPGVHGPREALSCRRSSDRRRRRGGGALELLEGSPLDDRASRGSGARISPVEHSFRGGGRARVASRRSPGVRRRGPGPARYRRLSPSGPPPTAHHPGRPGSISTGRPNCRRDRPHLWRRATGASHRSRGRPSRAGVPSASTGAAPRFARTLTGPSERPPTLAVPSPSNPSRVSSRAAARPLRGAVAAAPSAIAP